ncbi:Wzz/FepE/Etk N-terminal domain-containing protein [Photobacterium leiognathi]|uniref:Polysaccharide chain length determinant N-terminal domain-containing protein n=1 Tax=Photobacterium leiognathi TaxID=553611 RepID=A0ABX5GAV2_PHOLE|nr:Wzz/FepE/Etk N-terminal domain-containing protein [Photobacterium leiognathi]KJF90566.1 hypothetical protein UB42_07445 [Photobacterium leiognathi]PSV77673.1 hypothetical protein CTM94_19880 [Photobacterium leiognathi]
MSNIQAANNVSNDGIDFLYITKPLWEKKKWIILSALIFSLLGAAWAFSAQQWWTSTAVIMKGNYDDTVSLRNSLSPIYPSFDGTSQRAVIDNAVDEQELLKNFIIKFNSYNNKISFIKSNAIMSSYAKDANKLQFNSFWSKKISASLNDDKVPGIYNLTFQAKTPEESQKLLSQYINFVNKSVFNDINVTLKGLIDNRKSLLSQKKLLLENQVRKEILNETNKTEYSLKIAKAAEAVKPIPLMGNNGGMFSIELGSKGLAEKERLLKSVKNFNLFDPNIDIIKLRIDLLEHFKISEDVNLKSFHYLMDADYPLSRDKPKRVFVVILFAIIGVIFGSAVVFIHEVFKK